MHDGRAISYDVTTALRLYRKERLIKRGIEELLTYRCAWGKGPPSHPLPSSSLLRGF